jgi:hypothetical protein
MLLLCCCSCIAGSAAASSAVAAAALALLGRAAWNGKRGRQPRQCLVYCCRAGIDIVCQSEAVKLVARAACDMTDLSVVSEEFANRIKCTRPGLCMSHSQALNICTACRDAGAAEGVYGLRFCSCCMEVSLDTQYAMVELGSMIQVL